MYILFVWNLINLRNLKLKKIFFLFFSNYGGEWEVILMGKIFRRRRFKNGSCQIRFLPFEMKRILLFFQFSKNYRFEIRLKKEIKIIWSNSRKHRSFKSINEKLDCKTFKNGIRCGNIGCHAYFFVLRSAISPNISSLSRAQAILGQKALTVICCRNKLPHINWVFLLINHRCPPN